MSVKQANHENKVQKKTGTQQMLPCAEDMPAYDFVFEILT